MNIFKNFPPPPPIVPTNPPIFIKNPELHTPETFVDAMGKKMDIKNHRFDNSYLKIKIYLICPASGGKLIFKSGGINFSRKYGTPALSANFNKQVSIKMKTIYIQQYKSLQTNTLFSGYRIL